MFFRQLLNDDTACASYLLGCETHGAVRRRRPARRSRRRVHRARRGAGRADRRRARDARAGRPRLGPAGARRSAPARRRTCPRAPASSSSTTRSPTARSSSSATPRSQAIATPGHAPAHHAYLVTDHRRADEPWLVLTGDALLVGDAGRPDLHAHGEHSVEEMARTLYRSLTERLLHAPRPPRALPGALLGLGVRARAVGQPDLDDRLRAPPQPRAAVRLRGRVRARRCSSDIPPAPRSRRRSSPPTAPAAAAERVTARVRSGCARTSRSSRCWSPSTRSSARWSASSARRCRSSAARTSGSTSSAAVLSFIVAFGLAKALTNLGAGALAERARAPPAADRRLGARAAGPAADRRRAELGLDRRRQRPARRQPGPRLVHDRGDEDRPRRPPAPRLRARPQRGRRLRRRRARRRPQRLARRRLRRPRRARRRRRRDRAHRVPALGAVRARHRRARRARAGRSHDADEAPPALREAFAARQLPRSRRCAPARRPASSTTSTTALAWGLVPLFLAAHGAGAAADRPRRRALPGRLERRADRHRPLVRQRRPQAADRRRHAPPGGRAGAARRSATATSPSPPAPPCCSASAPRSSTPR